MFRLQVIQIIQIAKRFGNGRQTSVIKLTTNKMRHERNNEFERGGFLQIFQVLEIKECLWKRCQIRPTK